jgi:hypothetical protein
MMISNLPVCGCAQLPHVANMLMAATAITALASQPRVISHGLRVNWPITRRREPISIIMTMIGTAATPLITALQNSALIGSSGPQIRELPYIDHRLRRRCDD